jgi:hypothetical protein
MSGTAVRYPKWCCGRREALSYVTRRTASFRPVGEVGARPSEGEAHVALSVRLERLTARSKCRTVHMCLPRHLRH